MHDNKKEEGAREIRDAFGKNKALFGAAFLFSIFVNILMLTGPLYMLQVYDRVIGSRSEETLLALSLLVAFLYLMMAMLDYARGRVMARAAAYFQDTLDLRVFSAVLRSDTGSPGADAAATGLRDLDTLHRFLSSPVLMAFFDIPWTPIFLAAIFVFHPWLGILAMSGGVLLVSLTIMNQWQTRRLAQESTGLSLRAERMADQMRLESDAIEALGMRGATFVRWKKNRQKAVRATIMAADRAGAFTSSTKALRLFLQSAMLGLGALLTLEGQLSGGAMIAGSILLGRALAPVELAVGQWELLQRASKSRKNLLNLLSSISPEPKHTPLPTPAASLVADKVTVMPPGERQATLRMVSFQLAPGQALGVIGPSGSGKSTLARAITGSWRCSSGKIRLGAAPLDQYNPDVLGSHLGYLPQTVRLFDGTIAENIARLSPDADPEKIVAAAQKAAAHEMILSFPQGYDTPILAASNRLSGGQIQRIGLARALYGDPQLLVLDEPNSNLDNVGSDALNHAIRQMKSENKSVIIMAHRPGAIQECNLLLVLEGGIAKAFGPRDDVLKKTVQNAHKIRQSASQGGMQ